MNADEFKTQRRIKTVATRFGDLSLLGLLLLVDIGGSQCYVYTLHSI